MSQSRMSSVEFMGEGGRRRQSFSPAPLTMATKMTSSQAKLDAEEFRNRSDSDWQNSSAVSACHRCQAKFTLLNRKHHCRSCGFVFCGKCSSYELVVNGMMKRACFNCYTKVISPVYADQQSTLQTPLDTTMQPSKDSAIRGKGLPLTKPHNVLTIKDGESLPPWAEALVLVTSFGFGEGNQTNDSVSVFPEESVSKNFVGELLKYMKSPTLAVNASNLENEAEFTISTSDQEAHTGGGSPLLNCFFSCRFYDARTCVGEQHIDADRSESAGAAKAGDKASVHRVVLILVSRWAFPIIAFQALATLHENLNNQPAPSAPPSPGKPSSLSSSEAKNGKKRALSLSIIDDRLRNLLMISFGQISGWPAPMAVGSTFFPFFGEMLEYRLPADGVTSAAEVGTVFGLLNLVAIFGPLGLLQHAWALWELLVTGQDVLVMATSPTQASQMTIALASLLSPVKYTGSVRPYISSRASEVMALRARSSRKLDDIHSGKRVSDSSSRRLRDQGMIVGTDDEALLWALETFSAVLILPPANTNVGNPIEPRGSLAQNHSHSMPVGGTVRGSVAGESDVDEVSFGLHSRHAASVYVLDANASDKKTSKGKFRTFQDAYIDWQSQPVKKAAFVCRTAPTATTPYNIISQLKNLKPHEKIVLGDVLLRDHLGMMSEAFCRSEEDDDQNGSQANGSASSSSSTSKTLSTEAGLGVSGGIVQAKDGQAEQMKGTYMLLRNLPTKAAENIPLIILWLLYGLVIGICVKIGVHPAVLVVAFYLLQDELPWMYVPKGIEEIMRLFVPIPILYPLYVDRATRRQRRAARLAALNGACAPSEAVSGAPAGSSNADSANLTPSGTLTKDLSGVWKRVKTENFEAFFGAQGAGYVQRKIAASSPMTHTITMDALLSVFRLQERGGVVDTDTTYEIGGPSIKTKLLGKEFEDVVTVDESGNLVMRKVIQPDSAYTLTVTRVLDGDSKMKVIAVYQSSKDEKRVEALSFYEKQGPSTNALPASSAAALARKNGAGVDEKMAAVSVVEVAKKRDMSGVWERTKSVNTDKYMVVQGASYLQRKMIEAVKIAHTITMDSQLTALDLLECNGPMQVESTFQLGNEAFLDVEILGRPFKQRMYWEGESIVLHRVKADRSYELFVARCLSPDDASVLVMTSTHRDLKTKVETVATTWFARKGNSVRPVPKSFDSHSDGQEKRNSLDESKELVDVSDGPTGSPASEITPAKKGQGAALGTQESSANGANGSIITPNKESFRARFAGEWERIENVNITRRSNADERASAGGEVTEDSRVLRHIVTMEDSNGGVVRVREIGQGHKSDQKYICDGSPTLIKIQGKRYVDRCMWEGNTFVLRRVAESGQQADLLLYRDLEVNSEHPSTELEDMMRLVSRRTNRSTGEEAESVSTFRRIRTGSALRNTPGKPNARKSLH